MTLIKKFTEKDSEFRSIVDIYNMVSHDEKVHIDEEKEDCATPINEGDEVDMGF